MIIKHKQAVRQAHELTRRSAWYRISRMLAITVALCLVLTATACKSGGSSVGRLVAAGGSGGSAGAGGAGGSGGSGGAGGAGGAASNRFCSDTADAQFEACKEEVNDDFFKAEAICTNISVERERNGCLDDAATERAEADQLCGEQLTARKNLCAAIGEARYDPDFNPSNFDDDFKVLTNPNPYFPLKVGNTWEYEGGDETVTIEVLDKTKLIEGVTCIVVNDRVEEDGEVVEDTDDWFGQRKNGTVDYCGEISENFEFFEGDDPEEAELVDIGGSWKAGRDGAKSGTLFRGLPAVGATYRQEWAPSDAEDAATVLSTNYGFGGNPELDRFVPPALATLLCPGNTCVVTGEFSPLSPGGFERKYYASGIGLFLEVHPESGETVQLVDCNFDPRCAALPAP
ncbi:MAG: hypothetical protein ACRETN_02615 [Nevskiales bacterium]